MSHDNTNRGAIWPNKKKTTDTHPDFTGNLNVDGTEFWVSAWKKKPGDSGGSPSLRFSIKVKDQQQAPAPVSTPGVPADDDDIPW